MRGMEMGFCRALGLRAMTSRLDCSYGCCCHDCSYGCYSHDCSYGCCCHDSDCGSGCHYHHCHFRTTPTWWSMYPQIHRPSLKLGPRMFLLYSPTSSKQHNEVTQNSSRWHYEFRRKYSGFERNPANGVRFNYTVVYGVWTAAFSYHNENRQIDQNSENLSSRSRGA
jgi:hypothetical protein